MPKVTQPDFLEVFGHGIPAVRHDTPQAEIEASVDRLLQNLVTVSNDYASQVRELDPDEYNDPDFCPSQTIKLPVLFDAAYAGESFTQAVNLYVITIERLERNGLRLIDISDRGVLRFGGRNVDPAVEGQPAIFHGISVVTEDLYDKFVEGSQSHICGWVEHKLSKRGENDIGELLQALLRARGGNDEE